MDSPHESRLDRELRSLLLGQRVAALGTLCEDGAPLVSMVPYAIEPTQGCLVIHVSGLAAHTRNLQAAPAVSLLVMRAEVPGEPVHALPRVTLEGRAKPLVPASPDWQACRTAYLKRFPDAEPMTQLADFMFIAIHVGAARQVAGFGAARSIDEQELARVLRRDFHACGSTDGA
jgi:putative heme iron utilization protein